MVFELRAARVVDFECRRRSRRWSGCEFELAGYFESGASGTTLYVSYELDAGDCAGKSNVLQISILKSRKEVVLISVIRKESIPIMIVSCSL